MSDSQSDRQELLERQIIERVEVQVQNRLVAKYTVMGGLVFSVLGFFGYNVVQGISTAARETATKSAETATAPIIAEAKASLLDVEHKTADANNTITLVHDRLDAIGKTLDKGEEEIAVARDQESNIRAQSAASAQDMQDKFNEAKTKIGDLVKLIDDQKQRASGQFADAGTVADIAKIVQQLTSQINSLDNQVRQIAQNAQISITESALSTDTISKAKTVASAAATPVSLTVFFQFAILPRSQAKIIADALRQRGYALPGEEDREDSATNLHEVRYFFVQDRDAAQRLANDTTAILAQLGFGSVSVSVSDLTNYEGKKPRPGILELWLGLQPKPR